MLMPEKAVAEELLSERIREMQFRRGIEPATACEEFILRPAISLIMSQMIDYGATLRDGHE